MARARRHKSGGRRSWVPGMGNIKSVIDKGAKGLGYSSLAVGALSLLGQQNLATNPIVRYGAALFGGGIEGLGAQFLLGGGSTAGNSGGQIPLHG